MLNFDCAVDTKAGKVTIKNNVLTLNGEEATWLGAKMSAHDINNIINIYGVGFDGVTKATLKTLSFDDLVEAIKYYKASRDLLEQLKSSCCERGGYTFQKFVEKLNSQFRTAVQGGCEKLSPAESIVVEEITDVGLYNDLEFIELFNPTTMEDKAEVEYLKVKNFNYKKYLGKVPHKVEMLEVSFNEHLVSVKLYKDLISEVGNNILLWTDRKIGNRVRNTGASYYHLSKWCRDYQEHLKEKGVKVEPAKLSKSEKLKAKSVDTMTQDELIAIFKQGSQDQAASALDKMDFDSMKKLMESELVGVQKRLSTDFGRWRSNGSFTSKLIGRALDFVKTKEDYNDLIKFVRKQNAWSSVTWDFFTKNTDIAKVEDLVEMGPHSTSQFPEDSAVFFEKFLSKLSKEDRFRVHNKVTQLFVLRMNEKERLEFLETVKNHFGVSNSTLKIDHTDLDELYIDLNYDKVRKIIVQKPSLLQHFCDTIVKQKDKELALENLNHNSLDEQRSVPMFGLLSTEEKISVIQNQLSNNRNYYGGEYASEIGEGKAFDLTELPDLLTAILKNKKKGEHGQYIKAVFECIDKKKGSTTKINQVVQAHNVGDYPIEKEIFKLLDNNSKKHLLKHGINFKEEGYYGWYRDGDPHALFFSTMSREDLMEVYGEDLISCPHRKYIAHALTAEERHLVADMDKQFQRHNAELLGYVYFRKFELNKKALKELFGDLRSRQNRNFANQVKKMYEGVGSALRYILDLEEEVAGEAEID